MTHKNGKSLLLSYCIFQAALFGFDKKGLVSHDRQDWFSKNPT
jgi:hypothetical protein